jgi:allantoinase
LLTHYLEQGLSLEQITALTGKNPAERFGLRNKGRLEPGFDADLTLVDLSANELLTKAKLFYRHKQSPYVGETFKGVIRQTLVRGQTVFKNGNITLLDKPKFVRSEKH